MRVDDEMPFTPTHGAARPLPDGRWWVAPLEGAPCLLTDLQMKLLGSTKGTARLADFARKFCARQGFDDAQAELLEVALRDLAEKGLLSPARELSERIVSGRASRREGEACDITTISIMTAGRPLHLESLVRSLGRDANVARRAVRLVVLDDAKSAELSARNREVLRSLGSEFPIPVYYANRDDRARFAREIHEAGGPEERTNRFILTGDEEAEWTTGSSRNSLLFETSGERCLSLDDDLVLGFVPTGDAGASALTLWGSGDHSVTRWIGSGERAIERARESGPVDFLQAHETLLGRTLSSLVGPSGPANFAHVGPRLAKSLRAESRVVFTQFGYAGTSGTGAGPHFLFGHAGRSLRELTSDRSSFEGVVLGGNVLARPRSAVVSCFGSAMMGMVGLDNTSLLPCMFPVYVGEDDFLGFMLSRTEGALRGYLPFAVLHDPTRKPESWDKFWDVVSAPRFNAVVMKFLEAAVPFQLSSQAELQRWVAGHLRQVSALRNGSFREFIRETVVGMLAAQLDACQKAADRAGGELPSHYVELLSSVSERTSLALASPFPAPYEFLRWEETRAIERMKSVCNRYADAMSAWEEAGKVAAELRGNGRPMARKID